MAVVIAVARVLAFASSRSCVLPGRSLLVMRALPAEVVDAYEKRFPELGAPSPPVFGNGAFVPAVVTEREVAALWKALLQAFGGDRARALRAVNANPTIVHPMYTKPPALIGASKRALVEVMGSEDEALQIMLQNPAILQCGDSLRLQPADQIKSFAGFRAAIDRVPPAASRAVLFVFAAVLSLNFVFVRSDDPAVLAVAEAVKPVLGALCAALFLSAVGLSATSEAAAGRRNKELRE